MCKDTTLISEIYVTNSKSIMLVSGSMCNLIVLYMIIYENKE